MFFKVPVVESVSLLLSVLQNRDIPCLSAHEMFLLTSKVLLKLRLSALQLIPPLRQMMLDFLYCTIRKCIFMMSLNETQIFTMTCDLAKEKDCEEVVSNTMAHFKKLNVLVANAGILAANPLETMPMEEYDRMMNINCKS